MAGIRLGVNTLVWTGQFGLADLGLLDKVKAWGFDAVELGIFQFDGYPVREVRAALDATGLDVTAASALPPGSPLIDADAGVRARASDWLRKAAETVASLGGRILAGPFYSPVGYLPGRRRTPEEWDHAVEALRRIAPELAAMKVGLAIEPLNRFETYFLNTASDARKLVDAVDHPSVGILCDTFHSNIEEKDIAGAFRAAGPRLMHVHACENDRGIPGSGHIPLPAVFAALREMNYSGLAVIESFASTIPEIARAAAIWRDLAPTQDDIAVGGLRYLSQFR